MADSVSLLKGAAAASSRRSQIFNAISGAGKAIRLLPLLVANLVLAALIVILSGTVIARYVLGDPIYWADDFCSTLLLWLTAFGAVHAAQKNEHLRLTVLVDRLPDHIRRIAEAIASAGFLVFSVTIAVEAYRLTAEEFTNVIPALGVSVAWKTGALVLAFGLMSLSCVERLSRLLGLWQTLAIVGALVAIVMMGDRLPGHTMLGHLNIPLVFSVFLLVAVLSGFPIAVAFGLLTLGYLTTMTSTPLIVVANRIDEGMSNYLLLSVPLFILLGLVIERCGIAKAMIEFVVAILGGLRGGLHYSLLVAMYLVSGISGSKAADMAAVAPAMFPEMKARGAEEGELVALLGASAVMAETIPPSIVLIVIGSVCGISIQALFAAGYVPALIALAGLSVVVFFQSRKHGAPGQWTGRKLVLEKLWIALPGLALPLIIRLAVGEGFATATEVATIGIAYCLVIGGAFYHRIRWKEVLSISSETISLTGAIFLILGAASAMSWALTQSGSSHDIARLMTNLPGGAFGFLMASILFFALLGSLLEGLPAILIFGPLLLPVAGTFGINDVHYAMVVILAMGIGLFTPPIGIGFYAACAIAKVKPSQAVGKVWVPLAMLLVTTVIVAAFPSLTVR